MWKAEQDVTTKALIIYVSVHHGNTEKVARAMADAIGADLLPLKQASAALVEQYDLIGFGSGIYFGRHHKRLLDFVDGLPRLADKEGFVFATSGLRKVPLIHDFSKELKEGLRQKGFNVLGEFSCRGFDTWGLLGVVGGINRGRPNAGDLRRAADFALALRSKSRAFGGATDSD